MGFYSLGHLLGRSVVCMYVSDLTRLGLNLFWQCFGNVAQTFTSHGWGFGLLQHDLVEAFLLNMFSFSAHGYTRGTWSTPEECNFASTDIVPSVADQIDVRI